MKSRENLKCTSCGKQGHLGSRCFASRNTTRRARENKSEEDEEEWSANGSEDFYRRMKDDDLEQRREVIRRKIEEEEGERLAIIDKLEKAIIVMMSGEEDTKTKEKGMERLKKSRETVKSNASEKEKRAAMRYVNDLDVECDDIACTSRMIRLIKKDPKKAAGVISELGDFLGKHMELAPNVGRCLRSDSKDELADGI